MSDIVKPIKLHEGHIQVAVAMLLNPRVYTIVPNVFWSGHECDLLALGANGKLTEIEIKISAADLKNDFKKGHNHFSKTISRLVYAMPLHLCDKYRELIPSDCGIISITTYVYSDRKYVNANWYRQAKHRKDKQPPSDKEKLELTRLGCMRIWSLKFHNNKSITPNKTNE